jgi:ACS family hexuronate transporter-like MFS transporter
MENFMFKPEGKRQVGRVRWTICAMLFVATSINYMDRQVIGLLKPTLEQSIGLTEQSYGYIIAAFQVAYAAGLLLAGRMVDRLGSRLGYALIMGTWSLAAMAHALASSALGFGIARFFLGLGEAGNFPAAIKTVADWFPQRERSLATGIFNSGANLGAIVAPALIPWVTLRFGWRAAFLSTGIFSMAWIIWWYWQYRRPREHPTLTGEELSHIYDRVAEEGDPGPPVPWSKLLTYRQTWGFVIAKFLTDPIWWFYLFWLPSYFDSRFHLGLMHLGLPLILVYNMSAVGSIGGGWLPALFSRLGLNLANARMATMLLCACLALPMLTVGRTHSEWVAIALLSVAAGAHQGWSANLFTTASDMFPSNAVGSIVGIGGMAGSVGGVLLSVSAGRILQLTHSYTPLFALAGSVYLVAVIALKLLAPGLRRVEVRA